MFKRPGDPEEHNELYAIPTAALLGLYSVGYLAGVPEVASMAYLVSAGASIAAIGCLANQKTARTGNALGMMGVTGGIAATAGLMAPTAAVTAQLVGCLGAGLGAGAYLAQRMKITELPQMVAAFHSLVRRAHFFCACARLGACMLCRGRWPRFSSLVWRALLCRLRPLHPCVCCAIAVDHRAAISAGSAPLVVPVLM